MNERIRQLAEQANANELSYAYYRGEKRPENAVTLHSVDLEKFAELIVRECIDLASKEQKRYASITHRNMSECAVALGNFSLLMKYHFEDEQ
jgi:hypothetical protein